MTYKKGNKKRIIQYLKEHPEGSYARDIAKNTDLSLAQTSATISPMFKEGTIKGKGAKFDRKYYYADCDNSNR